MLFATFVQYFAGDGMYD